MKSSILLTCIFLIFSVISGCMASLDRLLILEDRLAVLEQRIATSEQENKIVKSNIKTYQNKQSDSLGFKVDKLSNELKILNGRLEESQYLFNQELSALKISDQQIRVRFQQIDNIAETNQKRVKDIENYLDFEITSNESVKKEVRLGNQLHAGNKSSDAQIYKIAKQAFDNSDFKEALKGFEKLLRQFPKSGYADNAQFWIGEIYYKDKWYEKAILEYQKVIEQYPTGNKIRAALLKQGIAFLKLDDKTNANLILNELVKKYPKSNEAKIARKKLAQLK